MSIEKLIKKILKEQVENVVHMTAEEFLDTLPYVNSDVQNLLRLPDYRNKQVIIDGDLDLSHNEDIRNLNLLSKIDGDLDIRYSNVDVFDETKVIRIFDYGSKRAKIRKQKELDDKFKYLDELRREGAWDIENGELISYETDALYEYLEQRNIPQVISDNEDTFKEDKYYIYPERYDHYRGKFFTWLGEDSLETDYIVYDERIIERSPEEAVLSRIDELGYDAFSEWMWEDHLDQDSVRDWLRWYIEDQVRDEPEEWGVQKTLSEDQEKYVEIYNSKINKLKERIDKEQLPDKDRDKLNNEISDIEDIIEDIEENPQGDYDENMIEETIDNWVDDNEDNFLDLIKDSGYDPKNILDYVDMNEVVDYVVRHDSWGDILGSYDGDHDEIQVGDLNFIVMRYN